MQNAIISDMVVAVAYSPDVMVATHDDGIRVKFSPLNLQTSLLLSSVNVGMNEHGVLIVSVFDCEYVFEIIDHHRLNTITMG